jgi:hypothetical protein
MDHIKTPASLQYVFYKKEEHINPSYNKILFNKFILI